MPCGGARPLKPGAKYGRPSKGDRVEIKARLPRWALAAVAAWAASEAGGGARDAPSAAAWTAAAGGRDPWLEAGWRRAGVTK